MLRPLAHCGSLRAEAPQSSYTQTASGTNPPAGSASPGHTDDSGPSHQNLPQPTAWLPKDIFHGAREAAPASPWLPADIAAASPAVSAAGPAQVRCHAWMACCCHACGQAHAASCRAASKAMHVQRQTRHSPEPGGKVQAPDIIRLRSTACSCSSARHVMHSQGQQAGTVSQ